MAYGYPSAETNFEKTMDKANDRSKMKLPSLTELRFIVSRYVLAWLSHYIYIDVKSQYFPVSSCWKES